MSGMWYDLEGKVALITGASRGIGWRLPGSSWSRAPRARTGYWPFPRTSPRRTRSSVFLAPRWKGSGP